MEEGSRSRGESVDFFHCFAKPSSIRDSGLRARAWLRRCGDASGFGWQRGADGYGHRKRTRVREACGGAIRPGGGGIHSSHGHFGRSIVECGFRDGVESWFCVVGQPSREGPPARDARGGYLARGAGVPAAALTCPSSGFVRMSAPADRTASATRRRSPVVNRATSMPASAGVSRGWWRRTRPGPRTRLRSAS